MEDHSDRTRFDDEQLQTWAALATVLEWLPGALDAQLQRDSGITHFEFGVLFALSEAAEGTLRMSILAGYSNSSLSRLSRAVARLETKDWVRRETDPLDGRYTLAILTETGSQKVAQAQPGHVETINQLIFDPLTSHQAKQLKDISHRITRAIRADEGWQSPSKADA